MQKKTKTQSTAMTRKALSLALPSVTVPTPLIVSPSTPVVLVLAIKISTTLGAVIEEILPHYFKSLRLTCQPLVIPPHC